ncbi:MAG: hypothetical protein ACI9R3_004980 [Verrucomicrobiales bacterium]|jgi:hypothetical protein
MHRLCSDRVLLGAILAITIIPSLGTASAQQRADVRTIKNFPDRLTEEQQAETVPPKKKGVRTAIDYERAKRERARRQAEAAANAEQQPEAKVDEQPKTVDMTRYAFKIPGADVIRAASQAGAIFSPKGGKPSKNGGNAAFQMPIHPGAMTSLARGHMMTQFRPHNFWVIESSSNQFHMFMDAKGKPLTLRNGWSVQEIVLKGENYTWVHLPKNGATSPYFVIEVKAFHHADTVVEIAGVVLVGPPGVKQWELAFIEEPTNIPLSKER